MNRPQKTFRLNYWKVDPEFAAHFTVCGDPAEVRMAVNQKQFVAVHEKGITLSPGLSNSVNIQGLSHNLKYGGMLTDLPFPMSLIPSTLATPMPKQVVVPPLVKELPQIKQVLTALMSLG